MELVKERRDSDIKIRVTKKQREEIQRLAAELGLTMTDYVRYCVNKVANEW